MRYTYKQYSKHFFAFAEHTHVFKIENLDAQFNSAQIINKNFCSIILDDIHQVLKVKIIMVIIYKNMNFLSKVFYLLLLYQ